MAPTTDLTFELDDARLVGGETLRGRLTAASDRIDAIRLEGRWQRRVDGEESKRGVGFEQRLTRDEQGAFPVEIEMPKGPYTFEDATATLAWELEAVGITDDGDEVATATRPLELEAGDPRERPTDYDSETGEGAGLPDSWIGNLLGGLMSALGQPTTLEEVHESLEYVSTGTGAYERKNSLMGNLPAIIGLLAFGLFVVFGAPTFFDDPHPALPWVLRVVGLALVGWGGWIFYKGIRNRMAEYAIGDVEIGVHPDQVLRGDTMSCTVAFSPEREVDLNAVRANLKCVRVEKTKGRRNRRHRRHNHHDDDDSRSRMRTHTYRDTLHSENLEIGKSRSLSAGERCAYAEQFTVPTTMKHSYLHTAPWWVRMFPIRGLTVSLEVKWVVELHIDIEDWPDWVTEYKCVVYP